MTPSPNTYPATSMEVDRYITTTLCPPGVTTFRMGPVVDRDATTCPDLGRATTDGCSARGSTRACATSSTTAGKTPPKNNGEVRSRSAPLVIGTGNATEAGSKWLPPGRFLVARAHPVGFRTRKYDRARPPRTRAARKPRAARTPPTRSHAGPVRRPPEARSGVRVPMNVPRVRRLCSGTGRSRPGPVTKGSGAKGESVGTRSTGRVVRSGAEVANVLPAATNSKGGLSIRRRSDRPPGRPKYGARTAVDRHRTTVIRCGPAPGPSVSPRRTSGRRAMALWRTPPAGSRTANRTTTTITPVNTYSATDSPGSSGSTHPGSTSRTPAVGSAPFPIRALVPTLASRGKRLRIRAFSGRGALIGAPRGPPARRPAETGR